MMMIGSARRIGSRRGKKKLPARLTFAVKGAGSVQDVGVLGQSGKPFEQTLRVIASVGFLIGVGLR